MKKNKNKQKCNKKSCKGCKWFVELSGSLGIEGLKNCPYAIRELLKEIDL